MTKSKQQIISEEMSRRAHLRKNRRGGFNDKVVIAKAIESRKRNAALRKAQAAQEATPDQTNPPTNQDR